MLSRHTRLLTCACFVLVLLLTAPGLAYGDTVSLDEVLKGNVDGLTVKVRGHGGWYGKCMTGDFENTTGQEIIVTIPVGLKLVPPDGSEGIQTMICSGYETLVIPAGSSEQQFTAFCGEKDDGPPSGTSGFTAGRLARPEIIRALERINEEALFDSNAQAAIWSLTDNLDVSENPEAEQYLEEQRVPAGKTLIAGLGAGLTGAGLAEGMRRTMGKPGKGKPPGSKKPNDGGPPWGEDEGEGGYDKDSKDGEKKEKPSDSDEDKKKAEAKKKAEEEQKRHDEAFDQILEFEEPDETSEERDKRKRKEEKKRKRSQLKQQPAMPGPVNAGDEQSTFRWDKKQRKLKMYSPGDYMEFGKGSFYISPHRPGTDPLELKPPSHLDADIGKAKISKRGEGYTITGPGDKKNPPWRGYYNARSGGSRLQKGYFVLDHKGQAWSVEDLVGGKRTGVTYDGKSDAFAAFRHNFGVFRKDGWVGVKETSPGGRTYDFRARTDSRRGFYGKIGDRWLKRDGDLYGAGWGNKSAVRYDAGNRRASVSFDTHGKKGVTTLTGGRGKQFGVERTQPIEVNYKDVRLKTSFTRYTRDVAGGSPGKTNEWGVGLGYKRVDVSYGSGGKVRARYRFKSW